MSKKALIVDDEAALREIIIEILKTLDFTSYPAENGKEAIKIASLHNHFDLFVIDMNMPGMSGEETYDNLKKNYPNTPSLFMSGYDLSDEVELLNLSCANTFLKKPFSISELTQIVSSLLS